MNDVSADPPLPRVGDDARLWRAVDVFRCATLIYAALLFLTERNELLHPAGGGPCWLVRLAGPVT